MSWVRSQRAAVVEIDDDIVLVDRRGVVRRLEGDSAELARVVLEHCGQPRTEIDVVLHVESMVGSLDDKRRAVVTELVALLAETGAIAAEESVVRAGANIVVCASGAIAASALPALVTALQRRGHTVEVALTETALRFVAIDALTAILQREVHTSMWPRAAHVPVPHVALAAWAELVLVYPASATTIARLAHGAFSDLVAAIALTTRAPVAIAPSMNPEMLEAPAVQRNLDQLRADGFAILGSVPSVEVAEAPSVRAPLAGAAPAPGEVAATIDALRAAGVLRGRDASAWEAAYRARLVPWASDACDPDLAGVLAELAPPPGRLLDLGCGLGQVARHAAARGYRVVATELAETALALASSHDDARDIVFVRDDIRATALTGPFDVIVDRATLHALPRPEACAAWAASVRKLTTSGSIVIVKAHRDGISGVTTGWSASALAALLPGFAIVAEKPAELPGVVDATPVPSVLVVLRRA